MGGGELIERGFMSNSESKGRGFLERGEGASEGGLIQLLRYQCLLFLKEPGKLSPGLGLQQRGQY